MVDYPAEGRRLDCWLNLETFISIFELIRIFREGLNHINAVKYSSL